MIWQLLAAPQLVALLLRVRPLLAGPQLVALLLLALLVRPQLLIALLDAALDVDLAADKLGREGLARERAIALGFLRGNLQRHGGEPLRRARCTGPHRKSGGAAVEHAELTAVAPEDFDPADPADGVRIELDRYAAGGIGRAGSRHLDNTRGAANAERRRRRFDLHVAAVGDLGGDERDGAEQNIERRRVAVAAFLVDEIVHPHLRVRLQRECGVVVEGDADRAVGTSLHHVALVNRLTELERAGGVVVVDGGVALQRGDAADRIGIRRLLRLLRRRRGVWRGRLGGRRLSLRDGRSRRLRCWCGSLAGHLRDCRRAPYRHARQNEQRGNRLGARHGQALGRLNRRRANYGRLFAAAKNDFPAWRPT